MGKSQSRRIQEARQESGKAGKASLDAAVVSCTFENTKWFYLTKRPENGLLADMWEFHPYSCAKANWRCVLFRRRTSAAIKILLHESDARGVSELFASVASPPCDINNEGEEKSEEVKTEEEAN